MNSNILTFCRSTQDTLLGKILEVPTDITVFPTVRKNIRRLFDIPLLRRRDSQRVCRIWWDDFDRPRMGFLFVLSLLEAETEPGRNESWLGKGRTWFCLFRTGKRSKKCRYGAQGCLLDWMSVVCVSGERRAACVDRDIGEYLSLKLVVGK